MIARIIRIFRLDFTVFREIAEDKGALTQAAVVVIVASLLSAIGSAGSAATGHAVSSFFISFILGVLVSWIVWAVLTYFVGTVLFQGKTDIPEMMRVLGFASAPRALGIFNLIICIGWIPALVGGILALIAAVLAIREAMEFETTKAILTALIAWVVSIAISIVFGLVFGVGFLF
jgi:hypothetical protein